MFNFLLTTFGIKRKEPPNDTSQYKTSTESSSKRQKIELKILDPRTDANSQPVPQTLYSAPDDLRNQGNTNDVHAQAITIIENAVLAYYKRKQESLFTIRDNKSIGERMEEAVNQGDNLTTIRHAVLNTDLMDKPRIMFEEHVNPISSGYERDLPSSGYLALQSQVLAVNNISKDRLCYYLLANTGDVLDRMNLFSPQHKHDICPRISTLEKGIFCLEFSTKAAAKTTRERLRTLGCVPDSYTLIHYLSKTDASGESLTRCREGSLTSDSLEKIISGFKETLDQKGLLQSLSSRCKVDSTPSSVIAKILHHYISGIVNELEQAGQLRIAYSAEQLDTVYESLNRISGFLADLLTTPAGSKVFLERYGFLVNDIFNILNELKPYQRSIDNPEQDDFGQAYAKIYKEDINQWLNQQYHAQSFVTAGGMDAIVSCLASLKKDFRYSYTPALSNDGRDPTYYEIKDIAKRKPSSNVFIMTPSLYESNNESMVQECLNWISVKTTKKSKVTKHIILDMTIERRGAQAHDFLNPILEKLNDINRDEFVIIKVKSQQKYSSLATRKSSLGSAMVIWQGDNAPQVVNTLAERERSGALTSGPAYQMLTFLLKYCREDELNFIEVVNSNVKFLYSLEQSLMPLQRTVDSSMDMVPPPWVKLKTAPQNLDKSQCAVYNGGPVPAGQLLINGELKRIAEVLESLLPHYYSFGWLEASFIGYFDQTTSVADSSPYGWMIRLNPGLETKQRLLERLYGFYAYRAAQQSNAKANDVGFKGMKNLIEQCIARGDPSDKSFADSTKEYSLLGLIDLAEAIQSASINNFSKIFSIIDTTLSFVDPELSEALEMADFLEKLILNKEGTGVSQPFLSLTDHSKTSLLLHWLQTIAHGAYPDKPGVTSLPKYPCFTALANFTPVDILYNKVVLTLSDTHHDFGSEKCDGSIEGLVCPSVIHHLISALLKGLTKQQKQLVLNRLSTQEGLMPKAKTYINEKRIDLNNESPYQNSDR